MPTSYYLQAGGAIVVLFFVLLAALRMSKMLQKKKYSGDIKVIDRVAVDQGVTLLMVQIEKQRLLLGLGGKEIQVLKQL